MSTKHNPFARERPSSVLEQMLVDTNTSRAELVASVEKNGLFKPKRAVDDSEDLRRILALPRRRWEDKADEYVRVLTNYLKKPHGTQVLRAIQAAALVEAHDNKGLLMPAAVGAGKSLVSLLVFIVTESRRPLLLLPAKLIDKTRREAQEYGKNWVIPGYIRIESYEKLGRVNHVNMLRDAQPDVLVCDECFPGETLVHTDRGMLSIRRIVDGGEATTVLAADEAGKLHWRRILRRFRKRTRKQMVRVQNEINNFTCTEDHKVWVERRGYVEATHLLQGDLLRMARPDQSTRLVTVTGIARLERHTQTEIVYDLEVDVDHNYFVTNQFGYKGVQVSNCHKLRHSSASVTKRVKRYLEEFPNTIFVGMSGTIMKRSLADFAHLAAWALRNKNPTPLTFNERITWGMALDQKRDGEQRLAPGALVQLCTPEERRVFTQTDSYETSLSTVRKAFMRRVTETPGIVATQQKLLGTSLRIENVKVSVKSRDFHHALESLRDRWERPDGEPFMDALELWRHLREISCGFYYRWNPAPPDVWRQRRRVWAKFVRSILKTNRINLDSEMAVVRAINEGRYDKEGAAVLKDWQDVRKMYDPEKNKEAVWIDDTVLNFCTAWMKGEAEEMLAEDQGGVVWVEHAEFGHELARRSKVPYYAQGGFDLKGNFIEAHPPGKPMIASVGSNAEGRNLQAWNRALLATIPQNGAQCEQLLGRLHREGQEADDVVYTFITTIPEMLQSFERARGDARAIQDMTGQPQKLLYADVVLHEFGSAPKTKKTAKK